MGLWAKLFGPRRIPADVLGVLDITGGAAADLIAADKSALAHLFGEVRESSGSPLGCTVLLVYCTLEVDGSITGHARSLREVIRDAGAPIVVVASSNQGDRCVAAAQEASFGRANLVLTVHRNGEAFPRFFGRLFADMKEGTSMPRAWVKLAPQGGPAAGGPETPETVFLCELGQIAFS